MRKLLGVSFLLLVSMLATASEPDFRSVFTETPKPLPKPSAPKTISPIDFTVRIRVQDGTAKVWYGSGTIIDGGVLTCAHVVPRDGLDVTVEHGDDEAKGRPLIIAGEYDVALLEVKWSKVMRVAELAAKSAAKGDAVTSCGRGPDGDVTEEDHIVSGSYRWEKMRTVEYSPAPYLGRSGGGIYNAESKIVGIVHAYATHNDGTSEQRSGIGIDLASIRSALSSPHIKPETPSQPDPIPQKRQRRRATVFTGESVYGDGWCINCTRLKEKWGNGNDDVEIIWSKEVAQGGEFPGSDSYPAVRFQDTTGRWRYPVESHKNPSYAVPSLEYLVKLIDASGGSQ